MNDIHGFYEDIRWAVRSARRAPGFFVGAMTIVALAIGPPTAVVSVVNAVAFRPLPVRAPERLVVLTVTDDRPVQTRLIHHSDVTELAKLSTFESLGLYSGGGVLWSEARGITGEGGIEAVEAGFHEALGLRPLLGRFFAPADGTGAGPAATVAVISHRFWQRFYASDPDAIGEPLLIGGVPFTVVGVTPREYTGLYIESGFDFSVLAGVLGRQLATNQFPFAPARPLRATHALGYLRQGVSHAQARVATASVWPRLRESAGAAGLSPAEESDWRQQRLEVKSLSAGFSNIATRHRSVLNALAGATSSLLVMACVSLMGLLIARNAWREPETAILVSLGASEGRLARQALFEALGVSLLGTAAGVLASIWTSQALARLLWEGATTLTLSVTPDRRVILGTVGVATTIAFLVSVLPALRLSRRARSPSARSIVRSTTPWSKRLLVVQVAISFVLLFVSGLFASSLSLLRNLDSGVRAEGIRWTRVLPQPGGYRDLNELAYYPELLARLSGVPGIESAALSHHFPAFFNFGNLVAEFPIARTSDAPGEEPVHGMMEVVSPGFFETLGLLIEQGRDFDWSDDAGRPGVALVNQALSRRLFPLGAAVGSHIRIGDDPARAAVRIIGIVPDATMGSYRATHQPVAFRSKAQEPRFFRSPVVIVRSRLPAAAVDQAVAATVSGMGREYVRRMYSLEEQVDRALSQERLMTWVSTVMAALAALVTAAGLFSVMLFTVGRRTREIGVRMALGATRPAVVGMIVREGLTLTILGIAIGLPAAIAAGQVTASMLFGVSSSDAPTLAASAALLVVVGLAACLWPASRAAAIAPTTALWGH